MSIPGLGATAMAGVLGLAGVSGVVSLVDTGAPPAVATVQAIRAGCPQVAQDRDSLVTATAISLAESNGRADAEGDTTITDGTWGPSYGIFQVRSQWAQQGTGQARDADRLRDPVFNAKAMCEISGGGENWRPWSVYLYGAYRDRLLEAEAAVADPRSGTVMHQAGMVKPATWLRPCEGPVTSGFGPRIAPTAGARSDHPGVDLGCPMGADVGASRAGVVTFAGVAGGFGNAVRLTHPDGSGSEYNHLSAISVSEGQRVTAGQTIGKVGSTGVSTGPHLHFEIWEDGKPVDPEQRMGQAVTSTEAGPMAQTQDKGPLSAGKVADAVVQRINEGATGTCRIARDPETPTLSAMCDDLGDLAGWVMGE